MSMTDYQRKLLESQLNSEVFLASIERFLDRNTFWTRAGAIVSLVALTVALVALFLSINGKG